MRSDGVIVGANIDTWLINVKGKLPDGLGEELDFLKEASQEADEDIPTRWTFAGETLFIRAHGSGTAVAVDPALPQSPFRHRSGQAQPHHWQGAVVRSVSMGARAGGCAASALRVPRWLLW